MNAWTEADDEILSKLWSEGFSASQIARQLSRRSRNAVIGRVHRLGLPRHTITHTIRPPKRSRIRISKKRDGPEFSLPPVPLPPPNANDIPTVSLMGLGANHCRWPCTTEGDPLDGLRFCGAPRRPGASYCKHHFDRAFNNVPVRPAPAALPVPEPAKELIAA